MNQDAVCVCFAAENLNVEAGTLMMRDHWHNLCFFSAFYLEFTFKCPCTIQLQNGIEKVILSGQISKRVYAMESFIDSSIRMLSDMFTYLTTCIR